jgi:dGTPase
MLKQLTWHYVINSPDLATIQEGQKRIIAELFDYLVQWTLQEANPDRIPTRLREILRAIRTDDEARAALSDNPTKMAARATADYIAGLTEGQAVELYGRLFGVSRSSIMHGWVRA